MRQKRLFVYDRERFLRNYSSHVQRAPAPQLDARLILYAHSLEKGLSHDKLRHGFGRYALSQLAIAMKAYSIEGYAKDRPAYVNALSVLKEYVRVHNDAGQDTGYLSSTFGDILGEVLRCRSDMCGASVMAMNTKKDNRTKDFSHLFMGRYSVRTFARRDVDVELLREAIAISAKSPSVCNRQPSHVRVIFNKQLISEALAVQGGINGYPIPPVVLAVTTDTASFVSTDERNQIYIDGGAFAMSLLLSLEYVGLAACPLNAMFDIDRDKKMRSILSVPENENFIMFVSVGHFKTKNNISKSFRYSAEEIMRVLE